MSAAHDDYRHSLDTRRTLTASQTGTEDIHVDLCTDEDADGQERYVMINGTICIGGWAALRQLAGELLAAADEWDKLEEPIVRAI